MQFRYLLLAFASQCALAAATPDEPLLEAFTLDNGEVLMLDPATVTPAFHPDSAKRDGGASAPVNPKQLFKRYCSDPAWPVPCQNGNLCCQPDHLCCENQTCIDPDIHNCCLYGYYCNKPAQCILLDNGNIACQG
ncbi:hypothetical protein FQN54_006474 [Arachnomyces sp. PD_36]|nr:hypothetical protein FQN54_006474 [Arachnomyces sp. PD_36]